MPNPFNVLNNNNNLNNLIQNPQQVLNMLATKNPQIYNLLKSGGNPEQLVRNICQQRGINVDEFMKNLGNIRF